MAPLPFSSLHSWGFEGTGPSFRVHGTDSFASVPRAMLQLHFLSRLPLLYFVLDRKYVRPGKTLPDLRCRPDICSAST